MQRWQTLVCFECSTDKLCFTLGCAGLGGVRFGVCAARAKLSGWVGERMRDININDGAEEYGQQQQPPRSYSPQGAGEQVSQLLSPCLLLPGAPACA